jgi:hypothetical protein
MSERQAAVAGPAGGLSRADALSAARRFRPELILICAAVGLVSILLGADNYWDLRYYHLYDPWAYLHDRYLYDIGPAQEQSFLNPVADLFFYALISSPLNETPRLVAFIMGAVHGINATLLFAIVCQVIRSPVRWECWSLRAAAWLMGISGAGFVSLIGTTSNDLTSALFVLAALYGLLKAADQTEGRGRGFAISGFLAGVGIALKFTSAVYAPGLGIVVLVAALRRKPVGALMAFGIAAALGFFAIAAHHMLTLWSDFGNPFFPYMNQVFRSPYFEPEAIRDARFIPQGFWALMTFPFAWTVTDTYIVSEPAMRDWRAAIAYVALVAAVLTVGVRCLRARANRADRAAPMPGALGLGLVFAFVVVSYFCWALGFGYYRYAVPLEMLTGVVTVGAVMLIFGDARLRVAGAAATLVLALVTTVYLDWGRRPYGDRYVDVQVPPLPPYSIVLIATWDPVAFFIPYAEPTARYIGIENNYLELSQHNRLATEVKRLMRTPGPPKFVLSVDEFNAAKLNTLLGQFGLELGADPCEPIRTNLVGHALALCRVAES